ncbi:aminodeoxychorismate/anthranilate synthase component II [Paludibacteraceae bacterium OttesenSCG-928-F17]|nr:aminodeoxychorismate/anthranilate synthase component II [Paludibacteraceae bacterium OttesenSCG-928-F17]
MNILLVDNYDSFTYNLVHLLRKVTGSNDKIDIIKNDKIEIDKVSIYDKIIISPGPGIPSEAGNLMPLLERWSKEKPILGICLGHQAIGEAFGAALSNLAKPLHGICSDINITSSKYIFKNLDNKIAVGRYHSWIVSNENFPDCLEITSVDENNQIMSLSHKEYDVHGLQFHPESILTPSGAQLIKNFLFN